MHGTPPDKAFRRANVPPSRSSRWPRYTRITDRTLRLAHVTATLV